MGLSIGIVSKLGKQPKCHYCQTKINRDEWHTIQKSKHRNTEKNWTTTIHLHFGCFQLLSHEEKDQLLVIVIGNVDVQDVTKKQLCEDIKKNRKDEKEKK